MDKFKNKYRIPTNRWQNWDYGSNAVYYITICTHKHVCYFGDVKDKTMHLSESGKMAKQLWNEIPNHFPFVELDVFVIMPNHLHGIIVINKIDNVPNVETRFIASDLSRLDLSRSHTPTSPIIQH
jgi:REP element-mobilizing transposase RayT